MAGRASSKVLGDLHTKLAQVMLEALEGEEFKDEETGEVTVFKANNPALFTAIAKFLKDNNIVAVPDSTDVLEQMKAQMANKHKRTERKELPTPDAGDMQWQSVSRLN